MMLLESSIRITVAALTVAAILAVLRVRSQALRHAIWTGVLAAMLLMPALLAIVPSIAVPLPFSTPATVESSVFPRLTAPPHSVPVSSSTTTAAASQAPQLGSAVVAPSATEVPSSTSRKPVPWMLVAYGIGVALAASWLAAGWIGTLRLARRSRAVTLPTGELIWESHAVAAPMTVGIFRPRIMFPEGWRAWPEDSLRACLAHEQAHVQRRDPVVALAARVNRCVFWFHPVAWWLPRVLAAAAEHVADDRAIAAIGERRRYAEVLLDIADAVRLRRCRVAWQAVGIDGTGLLAARIDRVLESAAVSEPSRGRRIAVVAACAAAVALAVACRAEPTTVAPLEPDPEVARQREEQKVQAAEFEKNRRLSRDEILALDASLTRTDADLDIIRKLQVVYGSSSLQTAFDWHEMIARRRPHIIWLVEHHPEHELAVWPVSPTADPVGYAELKKRWLAHAAKPDVTAVVLHHAARFFARFEPQQAEALWLRARTVDPEAKTLTLATGVRSGPQYWSFQLGSLYAQVLIGSTSPSDGRPLTPMGSDPYSVDVRRRLAASDDARMLVAAGQQLVRVYLGGERTELGIQLLERAVQLDPIDRTAVGLLARARGAQRDRQIRERLSARVIELASPDLAQKIRNRSPLSADELRERRELEVQALDGLSSDDRLVLLPQMAANDYMRAEAEAHSGKDRAAVDASFARSKHFAARALDTAETMRGSTEYPMAVYQSTVTLALHLLREGDRREAVRLMTIASEGPSATQSIPYFGLGGRLVNSMLNAGERESVAVFLERSARLLPAEAERLAGDAAAIRAGRMPLSYQYLMAQ